MLNKIKNYPLEITVVLMLIIRLASYTTGLVSGDDFFLKLMTTILICFNSYYIAAPNGRDEQISFLGNYYVFISTMLAVTMFHSLFKSSLSTFIFAFALTGMIYTVKEKYFV